MIGRRPHRDLHDHLTGALGGRRRRRLFERLSSDSALRTQFDTAVEGLRVLEGEGEGWADFELDLVHGRLFEDLAPTPRPFGAWLRRWRRLWWSGGALATSLAALLLWIRPAPETPEFTVRGDDRSGPLAVRALCGEPLRPAERGCDLSDQLQFAYRVDADAAPERALVLFGIDDDDRVLYYAPTPVDHALIVPDDGTWAPANFAVSLQINHDPGMLRVFGVLLEAGHTVQHEDIHRWANTLAHESSATLHGPRWTSHLTADPNPPCPTEDRCAAVELRLEIHPPR